MNIYPKGILTTYVFRILKYIILMIRLLIAALASLICTVQITGCDCSYQDANCVKNCKPSFRPLIT